MPNQEIKVIKSKDVPRKVTDKLDLDIIRHCKTMLSKIYAKHGIDYQSFDVDCCGDACEKNLIH